MDPDIKTYRIENESPLKINEGTTVIAPQTTRCFKLLGYVRFEVRLACLSARNYHIVLASPLN